jgi:sugar O-acyltransferase (sialic acid O-acetyltransferase NeuD family)
MPVFVTEVRDLLLIGAGGFSREAVEAIRAINAVRPAWNLLGFLDDDPARDGAVIGGTRVLGPTGLVHEHPAAAVVICTGRPDNYVSRKLIAERLGLDEERYATLIHPTATVGSTCNVGSGSVLLAHVDLTADVVVGRHVTVMPQVVLTHDVLVDDFVTIGSGVRIGGGAHIAEGAYLGAGASVREGLRIGERAMVGMAAVVTRDVPSERLWYGAPARDRDRAPVPQHRGAARA